MKTYYSFFVESNSSSQPSTPRGRSSHRSNDSTISKCSDCRHKCDNKPSSDLDNHDDFDDDSGILNEILNEGENSGSESNEGLRNLSDSLSSGSDSGFYHARGTSWINISYLIFIIVMTHFTLIHEYTNYFSRNEIQMSPLWS